ncbi:hypothetical protein BDZ89DRAFT_1056653 [Hymenopellis radicata]|nr:hypothetical protein BDZ89DRAFT_1056653 [Hymenopellis radicata]
MSIIAYPLRLLEALLSFPPSMSLSNVPSYEWRAHPPFEGSSCGVRRHHGYSAPASRPAYPTPAYLSLQHCSKPTGNSTPPR